MHKIYKYRCLLILPLVTLSVLSGCKKWYGVPDDKDYLSDQINFNPNTFSPVIGRLNLYSGIFNADNSTQPISFQIVNVRANDGTNNGAGTPSNDLTQVVPTLVWTSAYTGLEASIAEIEAKRQLENHPLFEARGGGQLILWPSSTNTLVPRLQAVGSLTAGYLFDVQVSNTGGTRTIKNLMVNPLRERPYEPSGRDATTGIFTGIQTDSILPSVLNGMLGVTSRNALVNNAGNHGANSSVWVRFKRTGDGNTLTFKFLDPNGNPINPALFNNTKWATLLHGFNMQMTNQYVRYDVAYPIPLTRLPTKYTTSDGSQATVLFSYTRLGFNGIRETGNMGLNFSIFRQGDWEIDFQFRTETPRFQDEF